MRYTYFPTQESKFTHPEKEKIHYNITIWYTNLFLCPKL